MDKTIFEFTHYKPYLRLRIGDYRQRRGQRTALAKALGCQPTFVTQVLNGDVHFSLEQADRLNRFLGHSDEEGDFFILLVQHERAGTKELEKYFDKKIQAQRSQRRVLTNRLGKETLLSREQQTVYYSSWHYGALHIAVAIPGLTTRDRLAEYFRLPLKKVTDVLEYLCSVGLVTTDGQHYAIGAAQIRLGNDSPNILRHHANWRVQAIESFDHETETDLHYSGVLCLSSSDKDKIKGRILDALKEQLAISDASKEEELVCYNIDLFSLKR